MKKLSEIQIIHIIVQLKLSLARYEKQLATTDDINNEWLKSQINVVKGLITTLEAEPTA